MYLFSIIGCLLPMSLVMGMTRLLPANQLTQWRKSFLDCNHRLWWQRRMQNNNGSVWVYDCWEEDLYSRDAEETRILSELRWPQCTNCDIGVWIFIPDEWSSIVHSSCCIPIDYYIPFHQQDLNFDAYIQGRSQPRTRVSLDPPSNFHYYYFFISK